MCASAMIMCAKVRPFVTIETLIMTVVRIPGGQPLEDMLSLAHASAICI